MNLFVLKNIINVMIYYNTMYVLFFVYHEMCLYVTTICIEK